MKHSEQDFINSVRDRFETSVQELDRETLSELTAIRAHALTRRPARFRQWFLVPAVALVILGLTLMVYKTLLQPSPLQPPAYNDIELMSAEEALELYDDVEFYEWLVDHGFST
jgi:hypothetical protein